MCSEEDLEFLGPSKVWYHNNVCFDKKTNLKIKGNWFTSDYQIPFIAFLRCEGKKTCKSVNETRDFLDDLLWYIISEKHTFDPHLFNKENKKTFSHSLPKSLSYKNFNVKQGEGFVDMKEITINLNQLKIDDGFFW